jgi:Double-GTPase 2
MTEMLAVEPDFDTLRFCPYHGEFIRLADCRIVATSTASRFTPGFNVSANPGALGEQAGAPDNRTILVSEVDGRKRFQLAPPPRRPVVQQKRFRRTESPRLPSAVELSGDVTARPARACPRCKHPLPASIDSRDPMSVSLVGHSGASKTTTLVALWDQLKSLGPGAIGMTEFQITEATALRMYNDVVGDYLDGGSVKETSEHDKHPPFEFLAAPGPDGQPVNLLLHDVAGEQLVRMDARLDMAPAVLWSDVVVFFYNPEAAAALKLVSSKAGQSVVLDGVRNDLADRPREQRIPPLVMLLCKADLVPPTDGQPLRYDDEEQIRSIIRRLGDGDVVSAAQRWPTVHWRAISAQPNDHQPRGVVEAFRLIAGLVCEST